MQRPRSPRIPPQNAHQAIDCCKKIRRFIIFHIRMVENAIATNPLVKYKVAR
jgi:hypothetical protein